MVAQFVEQNKQKCYQYFPENRDTITIAEDIEIQCATELNFGAYTIRTLFVEKVTFFSYSEAIKNQCFLFIEFRKAYCNSLSVHWMARFWMSNAHWFNVTIHSVDAWTAEEGWGENSGALQVKKTFTYKKLQSS